MKKSVRTVAFVLCVAAPSLPAFCGEDDQGAGRADASRYEFAANYLPSRISAYVTGISLEPHWNNQGSQFWYETDSSNEGRFVRVDPERAEWELVDERPWGDHVATPEDLAVSPNGLWGIRGVGPDLMVVDLRSGTERPLTTDGERYRAYGQPPDADLQSLTRRREGGAVPPVGWWSPDGHSFVTHRVNEKDLRELPYVVNVTGERGHQIPYAHVQKTAFPGDEIVPRAELTLFDLATGKRRDLETPHPMIAYSDTPFGGIQWSEDGERIYSVSESRDFRRQSVHVTNARTGHSREIVSVSAKLPIRNVVAESGPDRTLFRVLNRGRELILYSEEDNWAHYYLYDTGRGELVNRLTRGEWTVHDIKFIDEENRVLYFTAGGREAGRDPYYSHLYSVGLDGEDLRLLTPENAHHIVSFSPDGRYFVDTYSTVAKPPISVLRSSDGAMVMELQRADVTGLQALGWRSPERFSVKAADGKTDLYGVLFFPFDLDENASYPIIDAQYSGPQGVWAPTTFLKDKQSAMGLAQLGFVVMLLDARGTPKRSQQFQDVSFGSGFGSPDIVLDHITAIQQLAERYDFIDTDRVGIYGHSWGGYRAARAMFQFPKFFSAGFAASGSHDNFIYVFEHDRWFGSPTEYPNNYRLQSNLPLAGELEGKLILVHGDVDDNVHLANTLQLADALINANKKFEMFILPDRGHDITSDPYYIRMLWDYFVENLLGIGTPIEVNLEVEGSH